jgi:hypothetical protein
MLPMCHQTSSIYVPLKLPTEIHDTHEIAWYYVEMEAGSIAKESSA